MTSEAEVRANELLRGDDKIIAEAKQRFQQAWDWENESRAKFRDDLKFAAADPTNGWQWPGYLWSQRQDDPQGYKPRLTINKVRQHNLQIKNETKKNPPGIKISPVSSTATFKAAQAWMGLVRHIERQSKAKQAYTTANSFQVDGGIGYIMVTTDYVDDTSFDQEIFIKRVAKPLNVLLDPDANEMDKSDSNWGFYFEDVPTDQFLNEHPTMRDKLGSNAIDAGDGWLAKDHVRVAMYYVRTLKKDRLVMMLHPETKAEVIAKWSAVPTALKKEIEDHKSIIKEREIFSNVIKIYTIAADKILDEKEWPGRYIPIVPVIGEEVIIDNKLDRKGHTRNLMDAQRMYNFWTSSAVEHVALQTKAKWFIPVGATTNLETYYALINQQNYPFIPYNAMDEEGNVLPTPTPIEPPTMGEGFIKGMMIAKDELGMASGQREENMGVQTNAMTRPAINERQKPGETATYHFIDGLAVAIAQVGNIILDVAPHIYDTKQVKRILARDGTETMINIDPQAEQAYTEKENAAEGEVSAIFNPNVGRYWVEPDVGPGYQTQREEAWNAFVQITSQNAELVQNIGDIMFQYADFPGADEIAERLRRLVPPAALGEGPSADLQAAMEQNKQLQGIIKDLTEKLATQKLELKDKGDKIDVEEYRAQSDRIKQIGNAVDNFGEDKLRPLIEKIIKDMQNPQNDLQVEGGEDDQEEPPAAGARKAADGKWYVPHPAGGFAEVMNAQRAA